MGIIDSFKRKAIKTLRNQKTLTDFVMFVTVRR